MTQIKNLIQDGVTPEMIANTEEKFKLWDDVITNNILEKGTPEQIANAYSLLNDVTIFFYAFFRIPGTNQPYKLRSYQDLILNDKHDRIMFVAANQCIYEKEKVYILQGKSIYMKDIKIGQKILSYDEGNLVEKKVLWKSKPIIKNCYKLKTRTGKELILSDDHPILTPAGWKSIKDGVCKNNSKIHNKLKFEELMSMVCIPKNIGFFKTENRDKREITTLAYMMTDGSFGRDGQTPKFTNTSELLLAEFENDVKYFVPSVKRYKKGDGYDLIASTGTRSIKVKNQLTLFLKELDIWQIKKERTFPKIVWDYSKQDLCLFINRLYASDGTIFNYLDKGYEKCRIMFYSPNKDFIEDLKELLLKLGIHSNIVVENPTPHRPNINIGYRLTCQNPNDIIKFLDEIGDIYSKEEKSKKAREICEKQLESFYDYRKKFDNKDFFWDYITVLEHIGEKTCYDIEVEKTNNFITKGITVHNCGKSISLCCTAIHFAFLNPGTTVLMTSKTLLQAKDLLRQIKVLLQSSILDYKADIDDVENKSEIHFKHFEERNGKNIELPYSRIIVAPAGEGALGIAANLLLIDELAFYEEGEYIYFQILQPRTYATHGKIIVFSNPSGMTNIFYKLWESDDFHKYRFTYLDNPNNTLEEYNRLKRLLTQAQVDSTLDAKFTSAEGGFFTPDEIKAMQEDRQSFLPYTTDEPYYVAFDFAKSHDRTVRMIGIKKNNGIYVHEIKQYPQKTPYNEIIDELVDLIKIIGPSKFAMVGFDAGGPGSAITDWIKKIREFGVNIQPVTFSLQKKNSMYTIFKLLAEKNIRGEYGIKMPYTEYGDYQLKALRFKTSVTGKMTIHHESNADLDDVPDCGALLCSLIINPENPPVSVEIISNDIKSTKIDTSTRCECGNCLDIGDEYCSFCFKEL